MQAISMTKPMVSQSSSVGTTEIMVTPLPANCAWSWPCILSRLNPRLVHPRGTQIAIRCGFGFATS
jgi:hypothetical protein